MSRSISVKYIVYGLNVLLFIMACAVAVVTLECDSMDVPEAIGKLEICAILSEGDLAIPISINLNTICDQAGGEYINMA